MNMQYMKAKAEDLEERIERLDWDITRLKKERTELYASLYTIEETITGESYDEHD